MNSKATLLCFVLALFLLISPSVEENYKLSITEIGIFYDLQIIVGDTVVWVNDDFHNIHSTVRGTGPLTWDSGALYYGDIFSVDFTEPGVYLYSCSIHPTDVGRIYVFETDIYEGDRDPPVELSSIANSAPLAEGLFSTMNLPYQDDRSRITLFHFPPGQPPASSRGLPSSYAIYNGEIYYIASSDALPLRSAASSSLFFLLFAFLVAFY